MKKKIGILNLIEDNKCDSPCQCGWNLTIGGEQEDYEAIKEHLKLFKSSKLTSKTKKSKFKEGNIVTHNTGNRKMIVIDVNKPQTDSLSPGIFSHLAEKEFTYNCRWETKESFDFGCFKEYELKNYKKTK